MKTNYFILALTGILTFSHCAEDETFPLNGTVLSMTDIDGDWIAVYTVYGKSGEGPVVEYDLLEEGGTATLTIQSNGRFTLNISIPGEGTSTYTGQLGFDEELLVVTYDDEPDDWEYFTVQLNAGHLFISGPATFDFDGNEVPEDAYVSFEFVED